VSETIRVHERAVPGGHEHGRQHFPQNIHGLQIGVRAGQYIWKSGREGPFHTGYC
jgi:hypothetical protein